MKNMKGGLVSSKTQKTLHTTPMRKDHEIHMSNDEEDPGLFEKVGDVASKIAAHELDNLIDATFPHLDTMNNTEISEVLKDKAQRIGAVAQTLAEDPQVQEVIEETGDALAKITGELVEAVDEPIEQVTDLALRSVENIAVNTGKTAIQTGTKFVMALLAEIPGLGGVIDLTFAGLNLFDGLAKNAYIFSEHFVELLSIGNKLTGDALKPVENAMDEAAKIKEQAVGIVDKIEDTLTGYDEKMTSLSQPGANLNALLNAKPKDPRPLAPRDDMVPEEYERKEQPRQQPIKFPKDTRLEQKPLYPDVPVVREARPGSMVRTRPGSMVRTRPGSMVRTRPLVGEAKPRPVVRTRPLVGEAKPRPVVRTRPLVGEARPVVGEARPVVSKARPVVGEARPVVSKARPLVGEARPVVGKTQRRSKANRRSKTLKTSKNRI